MRSLQADVTLLLHLSMCIDLFTYTHYIHAFPTCRTSLSMIVRDMIACCWCSIWLDPPPPAALPPPGEAAPEGCGGPPTCTWRPPPGSTLPPPLPPLVLRLTWLL